MTRTLLLVAAALLGFAGNSLLCRLALAAGEIDATSFTAVRLASGALVLALLAFARTRAIPRMTEFPGDWRSAAALFGYALPFSLAYLKLSTGTGALVLFGVVQATMIGGGLGKGERPTLAVWLGWLLALGGLVVLTAPGVSAPDPLAAASMAIAGAAWAIYSLRGKGSTAPPLSTTAGNFIRCVPLSLAALAIAALAQPLQATARGVVLAATSGALASGIGYSLWYAALPRMTATRAAIVQLLVPIVAALGGVALLDEQLSTRLLIATTAIVGGVALAITRR